MCILDHYTTCNSHLGSDQAFLSYDSIMFHMYMVVYLGASLNGSIACHPTVYGTESSQVHLISYHYTPA